MSDESTRSLERRWKESGDEADARAYLQALLRVKGPADEILRLRLALREVDERAVRLAAHLGSATARAALGGDVSLEEALSPWFWELLDASRPDTAQLVYALVARGRREIALFRLAYDLAMEAIKPADAIPHFREWVVGEGLAVWRRALEADDLADLVREMFAQERVASGHRTHWRTSVRGACWRAYDDPEDPEANLSDAVSELLDDPERLFGFAPP